MYNPKIEKFVIEFKNFYKQNPDYTLGQLLYSLNTQANKKGKNLFDMSNDEVIECIEKAITHERD